MCDSEKVHHDSADSLSLTQRLRQNHLSDQLCRSWLVYHLLAITFATGLLDATTYADLQVFCSNQTGNTIVFFVLALGVFNPPLYDQPAGFSSMPSILTTGVSLISFLFFGFVFGQLGNRFGCRKRGWLLFSMTMQSVMLMLLIILLDRKVIKLRLPPGSAGKELHNTILAFLLASLAGVQVAMARSSGINEIPTAMLTSPFIDFLVDKNLFSNPKLANEDPKVKTRNIRFCYIFSLIFGAIIGSVMHRQAHTVSVFYLAFSLRVLGIGLVLVAPKDAS